MAEQVKFIEIVIDDSGAIKSLRAIDQAVAAVGATARKTEVSVQAWEQAMRRAAAVGTAIGQILGNLANTAIKGLIDMFGKSIDNAVKLQNALLGLGALARSYGVDVDKATEATKRLASDGLISVTGAANSLKNLIATGFDLDQAVKIAERFKDIGAFNRQGSLSLEQAMEGATQGLKNQMSQLVDNIGLTKNLSNIMKEAGLKISDLGRISSDSGVRLKFFNQLMKESQAFAGQAGLAVQTYSGQVGRLQTSWDNFLASIGQAITTNAELTAVIQFMGDILIRWTRVLGDTKTSVNLVDEAVLYLAKAFSFLAHATGPVNLAWNAIQNGIARVLQFIADALIKLGGLEEKLLDMTSKAIAKYGGAKSPLLGVLAYWKAQLQDAQTFALGFSVEMEKTIKANEDDYVYVSTKAEEYGKEIDQLILKLESLRGKQVQVNAGGGPPGQRPSPIPPEAEGRLKSYQDAIEKVSKALDEMQRAGVPTITIIREFGDEILKAVKDADLFPTIKIPEALQEMADAVRQFQFGEVLEKEMAKGREKAREQVEELVAEWKERITDLFAFQVELQSRALEFMAQTNQELLQSHARTLPQVLEANRQAMEAEIRTWSELKLFFPALYDQVIAIIRRKYKIMAEDAKKAFREDFQRDVVEAMRAVGNAAGGMAQKIVEAGIVIINTIKTIKAATSVGAGLLGIVTGIASLVSIFRRPKKEKEQGPTPEELARQAAEEAQKRADAATKAVEGFARRAEAAYRPLLDMLEKYDDLQAEGADAAKDLQAALASGQGVAEALLRAQQVQAQIAQSEADINAHVEQAQRDFGTITNYASATFAATLRTTGSLFQAWSAVKGPVNDLITLQSRLGLEASGTTQLFLDQMRALDKVSDILEAGDSVAQMIRGLSEAQQLSAEFLASAGHDVVSLYDQAIDRGLTASQALTAVQPGLQALWEASQKYGFSLDEATQALVDQGIQAGIVGNQQKSINEQLIGVLTRLADLLEKNIVGGFAHVQQAMSRTDWEGWAKSGVDAMNDVQDATSGLVLGNSPGLVHVPQELDKAIESAQAFSVAGERSMDVVRLAIVDLNAEQKASLDLMLEQHKTAQQIADSFGLMVDDVQQYADAWQQARDEAEAAQKLWEGRNQVIGQAQDFATDLERATQLANTTDDMTKRLLELSFDRADELKKAMSYAGAYGVDASRLVDLVNSKYDALVRQAGRENIGRGQGAGNATNPFDAEIAALTQYSGAGSYFEQALALAKIRQQAYAVGVGGVAQDLTQASAPVNIGGISINTGGRPLNSYSEAELVALVGQALVSQLRSQGVRLASG